MKISTIDEMRELDKKAVESGIKEELLMENAGHACYFVLLKEYGIKGKNFIIFAGSGNNGGDGLVVARKIRSNGGNVIVYTVGEPEKYRGSALLNFEIVKKTGIEIRKAPDDKMVDAIKKADVVIDAMIGTGLSMEVRGVYKDVINAINENARNVVSIDIPSGINGNNGRIMGCCIKASCTVTFGLPKLGNILYPGYEMCGKLYVSHISFPPSIYSHLKIETNDPIKLPERKKDGHKGDFGDVLFVSGASRYYGAPYLAAMSFLKAGGGYARLASPESVVPYIASGGREIVFHPMHERNGALSIENEEEIIGIANKCDMLVIGGGLSLNDETKELVRRVVKKVKRPVLIDGDGITAISEDTECISGRKETIITPHPGEMSRLTGKNKEEILADKIKILRETAEKLNSIIVLKGAHSLIGYPDGKIYVNMSGNPGMATAGSGDVLAGTIPAMYGIGFSLNDAVRMGVMVHGFAGDLAAERKGEDGITARDIMEFLPEAMMKLRKNFEIVKKRYEIEVI